MRPLSSQPVSYDMVSTYAKWCGIRSEQNWVEYHRQNSRPNWVPEDPAGFFLQQGQWPGWEAFLGEIEVK